MTEKNQMAYWLTPVYFGGFDDIHAAVAGASPIFINGIAGIFLRQLIDMIARTILLFVCLADVSLNFDSMAAVFRIKDEQRKFVVGLKIAGFLGIDRKVDTGMFAVKIAPNGDGMRLSVRVDGGYST